MQLLVFSSWPFGLHLWVRILNVLPALSSGMAWHVNFSLPLTSPPLDFALPVRFLSSPPNHFVCRHQVQSFWYHLLQAVGQFTCKALPYLHLCLYKKKKKNPLLPCCLQWIVLTFNKLPIVILLPVSCHLVCPWLWNVSLALNLLSGVLQALFL